MSTILIVYEREMEQNALEKALSESGHTVVRAANGLDALESARHNPPNLVISDILLPKMDGFALCKKWKQDDRLLSLPFMFYTRKYDDPKYQRFASELSADCFMERSNDRAPLLQAVEELLSSEKVARKLDPIQAQALGTGAFLVTSKLSIAPEVSTTTFSSPPVTATSVDRSSTDSSPDSKPDTKPDTKLDINGATLNAPLGIQSNGEDRSLARETKLMARVAELGVLNKQLQSSEQQFRQLFDASPVPLWFINEERRCTAVNHAALALYGFTQEEFLALPRNEPPFSAGAAIQGSAATWHRNKSGSAIAVELVARAVDSAHKRGEIVAAYDATQRVFAERATSHAGDAYQALLIAAADGFWLLDDEQHLIDVNEAYCRMSGYSRDELLKLSPADLETKVDTENSIRLQQKITEQSGYESIHRRKDGTLYPVEISIGGLTGARPRTVVLVRDITLRQRQVQSEQRTRKAQQAALELLNGASALTESQVLQRTVELLAEVSDSPLAFFCGTEDAGAVPLLLSVYEKSRGHAMPVAGEARKLRGKSLSSECLRNGQALLSNDGQQSERSPLLPAQESLLMLPLERDSEPLGTLTVANRSEHYAHVDISLLAPIAEALTTILLAKRAQATSMLVAQGAEAALQRLLDNLGKTSRHS